MRFLLSPVGSRGDVQPMLVLGAELAGRGHTVTLAAPPNFQRAVAGEGLAFWPTGEDTARTIEENKELAERSPLTALPAQVALLKRGVKRQLEDIAEFSEPVDVVVAAGLSFGAHLLADKRGARYAYVCYTLPGLHSARHAPAVLPLFGLPSLANRALWSAVVNLFDGALQGLIARERALHDLPPVPAWRSIHASRTLLAQDELFGSVPADAAGFAGRVPAIVRATAPAALPDSVERFLAAAAPAQPVVYFGFGSMPAVDRERLVASLLEVERATSARILFFSPEATEPVSDGILALGDLDHRALFPRVDLIVHHGGAGTTATALRAGVPQFIVPHIVDQFFHGRRIHELGLGPRPVKKGKLAAADLIAAVDARTEYRERARAVGSELAGTSGAREAADFLERLSRAEG
ncbi:MAG TPA: glycosyltransferase [Polyangiaceae bacterium]